MPKPGEYLLEYRDESDAYIPQYAPRKEWGPNSSFDPHDLVDIVNKVMILLLSVMRNVLGEIVYIFRLEDPVNLPQGPLRLELWVNRKGSLSVIQLSPEQEQELLQEKLPRGYRVLPNAIKEIEHKANFVIGGVMANSIGEIVYLLYLEDPPNLKDGPVGGELYVRADGKVRIEQTKNPEQLILGLRAEQQE